MEEVTRDALVSVTLFAAVFGMVYVFLMTRHRERMTILEKNINPSPFKSTNNTALLKYGIIWLGVSIGLIVGNLLYNWGVEETFSYASMVFMFSGIGMIVAYFVAQKQNLS